MSSLLRRGISTVLLVGMLSVASAAPVAAREPIGDEWWVTNLVANYACLDTGMVSYLFKFRSHVGALPSFSETRTYYQKGTIKFQTQRTDGSWRTIDQHTKSAGEFKLRDLPWYSNFLDRTSVGYATASGANIRAQFQVTLKRKVVGPDLTVWKSRNYTRAMPIASCYDWGS